MKLGHQAWAKEQSANTQRDLILVAMRLMARKGIEGVSLRSVNQEAGSRNSSAAHYHFGSKVGLVRAIVELLAAANARWRGPFVANLKTRSARETITVRDVVEAVYLPFFGFFYHAEFGRPATKFLSRLVVNDDREIRPLADAFVAPIAAEAYELLAPILPHVSERVLKSRIVFSLTNLINGGSDAFTVRVTLLEQLGYDDSMDLLYQFTDYLVAGLSAAEGVRTPSFDARCEDEVSWVRATDGVRDVLESIDRDCDKEVQIEG